MYFTTHLLAGCALGAALNSVGPGAGTVFAAGLALHAALDCVPHHDYHRFRYGVVDVSFGTAVAITAAGLLRSPIILAGAIGCAVPDVEIVYRQLRAAKGGTKGKALFPSHSGLLPHPSLALPWGFVVQACCAAMSLVILRALR